MTPVLSSLDGAIALRQALTRLSRRLRSDAREPGLSVAKHSVLGHLYRVGLSTPGALAMAEGVQPQSMTRVLADLEDTGLAVRQQDDADRRQFKVEITIAGREILERDARKKALWLASAMSALLSPTERELLRLAAQLMERLADAPSDQVM